MIKKILQVWWPIFESAEGATFVLVAPTPRCVTRKCCADSSHIDNYDSDSYEPVIQEGIDLQIQILNTWATGKHLHYYILDPVSSGEASVPPLCGTALPLVENLCVTRLTVSTYPPGGYHDLAEAIAGLSDLMERRRIEDGECSIASCGSWSKKRASLDTFIVKHENPSQTSQIG